ncbi:uncharacterized protein LOC128682639 [Plodia interpunctella]|uniref:uncharacterized protein LOC128682639 n=1 Tax=Plodia interpunctella TaxID=58824 RepID=UPI00236888CC|nr:uncharacterized protein LOC128682639 [Plodia interpunctella]
MEQIESVWDYFNKCISSDNYKRAQCKICNNIYSHATTITNLKTHLLNKHGKSLKSLPRQRRSSIQSSNKKHWDHFTNDESDSKVAICNYCLNKYSYKTSINNLTAHLAKKHPDVYEKHFEKIPDLNEVSEEVYLECDDDESDESTKFASKVSKMHSELAEREDEVSDLLLREENDNSDVFTEVVYLDNQDDPSLNRSKRRTKWRSQSKKIYRRRQSDSSSEDKKSKVKKRKVSNNSSSDDKQKNAAQSDDEIEKFANYITCLLKKMPHNVSRRIQKNIINMILTTDIEDEQQNAPMVHNLEILKSVPLSVTQPVPAYLPSMIPVTLDTALSNNVLTSKKDEETTKNSSLNMENQSGNSISGDINNENML